MRKKSHNSACCSLGIGAILLDTVGYTSVGRMYYISMVASTILRTLTLSLSLPFLFLLSPFFLCVCVCVSEASLFILIPRTIAINDAMAFSSTPCFACPSRVCVYLLFQDKLDSSIHMAMFHFSLLSMN